jgi:hypothetical protein
MRIMVTESVDNLVVQNQPSMSVVSADRYPPLGLVVVMVNRCLTSTIRSEHKSGIMSMTRRAQQKVQMNLLLA